ncbi:MAG: hypothetical protein HC871_16740, partial [Rhizobiales bacterium]|nr:hypothetical protein [Hyphomicrobiales bacterium]
RAGGEESALIMLTAEGNEQLAREALQLGILDYLPKQDLGPESWSAPCRTRSPRSG